MFSRYSLRTTDAESARRFYRDALGLVLPEGSIAETSLECWPLHERALANGVPAHWLGHVEVDDPDASVAEMLAMGASQLGPTVRAPNGASWATVRDPFGAPVALRARAEEPPDRPVVWHQLHTTDLDRAWALFEKIAGWRSAGTIEAADVEGGHRLFTWSGPPVGSVGNTARWPGVHAHWLYYFPVDDVDATAARVREMGGTSLVPNAQLNGRRVAVCEDPQRAAFGVIERA